ncbi:MAG: TSUP family transporter [Candidatus Coproplasma sp.]
MKKGYSKAIVSGVGLGAVNGFFGGGGGMIAVPLLSGTLGYTDKQAHATAILVIAPVCLISAIVYIIGGFTRADVIIPATIGNVTGGLLGAELLGKIPEIWTDVIFIAVLVAAGVKMVI